MSKLDLLLALHLLQLVEPIGQVLHLIGQVGDGCVDLIVVEPDGVGLARNGGNRHCSKKS